MTKLLDNIEISGESLNGYGNGITKVFSPSELHFKFEQTKRIDYVLLYKEGQHSGQDKLDKDEWRENYLKSLRGNGIDIEEDQFVRDSNIIRVWKLHAQFECLCDMAEDLQLKKETKESDILIRGVIARNMPTMMSWIRNNDPFTIQNAALGEEKAYFVEPFDKERLTDFKDWNRPDEFFTVVERNRIVHYICSRTDGGIAELLHCGVFSDAYPLHLGPLKVCRKNPPENMRQKLEEDWACWRKLFKYQPIQAIKTYFGEKIGLYFCWLGFYTSFLLPAAITGFLCFLYGVISSFDFIPAKDTCDTKNDRLFYQCPLCDRFCSYFVMSKNSCLYTIISHFFDNKATLFFAAFMSFWATFFLEFWKRKQASLAYEWHTRGYEEDEEKPRPEYIRHSTTLRRNMVTQRMEPFVPNLKRLPRVFGAFGVVTFFVAMVVASLIGVIVYRAVIYAVLLAGNNRLVQTNAKIIVSGTAATINLIIIFLLRFVYSRLAKQLTDWETPRTLTDYEDSFTIKMFWFQFVNTYSSVFYVAFFKNTFIVGRPGKYRRFSPAAYRLEGCSDGGCFLELSVQLIVIMVGQQFIATIQQIVQPRLEKWYRRRSAQTPKMEMPQWERDFDLEPREELSLFWEYLEIVLQYGFVTMFVAAFPLAPLFALLNNIVEIRVDAINFVRNYRRPVPHRAEDIGAWYTILTTLTEVSVLVNALVIAFTSDLIPRIVYVNLYSKDGTLTGYVNFSLSYFDVADFTNMSRPENPTANVPYTLPYCRYLGFYEPKSPYNLRNVYYIILSVRLGFVFLFQWLVTATTRIIAWYIPDVPKMLKLKIKRENFLAREAMKAFKERKGRRKPRLRGEMSFASFNERTPLFTPSHEML